MSTVLTELTELREYAEANGGITAVASSLGVTKGVFWAWLNRGQVPPQMCPRIVAITDGAVRHWHLRPDDWYLIWPELIGADGAPDVPAAERVA